MNNFTNTQLNLMVAQIDPRFKGCIDLEVFPCEDVEGDVDIVSQGLYITTVNYCDKIEDFWHIMQEECIDIEWPVESLGGVGTANIYREGDSDLQVDFTEKENALRSSVMCYLYKEGCL